MPAISPRATCAKDSNFSQATEHGRAVPWPHGHCPFLVHDRRPLNDRPYFDRGAKYRSKQALLRCRTTTPRIQVPQRLAWVSRLWRQSACALDHATDHAGSLRIAGQACTSAFRPEPRVGRRLPCRRSEHPAAGKRSARATRGLRLRLLRCLPHRPRRLSHRGLFPRVGPVAPVSPLSMEMPRNRYQASTGSRCLRAANAPVFSRCQRLDPAWRSLQGFNGSISIVRMGSKAALSSKGHSREGCR